MALKHLNSVFCPYFKAYFLDLYNEVPLQGLGVMYTSVVVKTDNTQSIINFQYLFKYLFYIIIKIYFNNHKLNV